MKELHLQFVHMEGEVRMNNDHGRKMLITEKHHGHDLTLLEVVFKLRKHQSVYQISSPSLPLAPASSPAHLSFSFLSHLVSQQSTAGSGAGDLVGG